VRRRGCHIFYTVKICINWFSVERRDKEGWEGDEDMSHQSTPAESKWFSQNVSQELGMQRQLNLKIGKFVSCHTRILFLIPAYVTSRISLLETLLWSLIAPRLPASVRPWLLHNFVLNWLTDKTDEEYCHVRGVCVTNNNGFWTRLLCGNQPHMLSQC
jgi:hypothetical protein